MIPQQFLDQLRNQGLLGNAGGDAPQLQPQAPQQVPYAQSPLLGGYSQLAYQMAGPGPQPQAPATQQPSAPPAHTLPPNYQKLGGGGIAGGKFNPFSGGMNPAALDAIRALMR